MWCDDSTLCRWVNFLCVTMERKGERTDAINVQHPAYSLVTKRICTNETTRHDTTLPSFLTLWRKIVVVVVVVQSAPTIVVVCLLLGWKTTAIILLLSKLLSLAVVSNVQSRTWEESERANIKSRVGPVNLLWVQHNWTELHCTELPTITQHLPVAAVTRNPTQLQ